MPEPDPSSTEPLKPAVGGDADGLRRASAPIVPLPALGIVAGGGAMPLAVAARAVAAGRAVHIVGLLGEADPAIQGYPHTWVPWGAISAMLGALKQAECRDLVIVGAVTRPKLATIRPDLGLLRALPELLALRHGGDDSVLSRVVRFFERRGFHVVGAHEIAPELVMHAGSLGRRSADAASARDIATALDMIEVLGPFDVGQAAVVRGGKIMAIEGAEGTDAMLSRAAAITQARPLARERTGVLVKRPKPGQEMRVDMPAIGPRTVARAVEAKLAGLAVLAGEVLIIDRAAMIEAADAQDVFIDGVRRVAPARSPGEVTPGRNAATNPDKSAMNTQTLVGRPSRSAVADIALGVAASRVLATFDTGDLVVVSRRHILAIAAAEPAAEAIARAARLRQWGAGTILNGRGVAVVRETCLGAGEALTAVVRAADAAKIAGVAIIRDRPLPWPASAGKPSDPNRLNEAELLRAFQGTRMFAVLVEELQE